MADTDYKRYMLLFGAPTLHVVQSRIWGYTRGDRWYYHRVDGPALETWRKDGVLYREWWHNNALRDSAG